MKAKNYNELMVGSVYSVGEIGGCYVLRFGFKNTPYIAPALYCPITEKEFKAFFDPADSQLPVSIGKRPIVAAEFIDGYDDSEWVAYRGIPCRRSQCSLSPYTDDAMEGWDEQLMRAGFSKSDDGKWNTAVSAELVACH